MAWWVGGWGTYTHVSRLLVCYYISLSHPLLAFFMVALSNMLGLRPLRRPPGFFFGARAATGITNYRTPWGIGIWQGRGNMPLKRWGSTIQTSIWSRL